MKLENLKLGVKVQFIEAAGLGDKEYDIHSVDQMSWTVRLDGVMGSYSIDHIVGLDASPTIPADEIGTLRTAAVFPSDAPRVLPKIENPKSDDDAPPTNGPAENPLSIFDALRGMDAIDLLDALEGHLRALVAYPDPIVKYHARNALIIQWAIEALPPEEEPESDAPQEEKTS